MSLPRSLALVLAFAISAALHADVTLTPLFCDHAVLQRGKAIPVWGRATPGESVTVNFLGQRASATADRNGRWAVCLAPLAANATGTDLVAMGRTTVTVHDVVVGEVWICSGQSNMEFTVNIPGHPIYRLKNASQETASAHYPLIRHFKVQQKVANEPVDTLKGAWAVCSPETVGQFTAVGYFFARDIHLRLGVPVGIINSTFGGTPVEAWMSADALASDPAFSVVGERWKKMLSGSSIPNEAAYQAAYVAWCNALEPAAKAGGARLAEVIKRRPFGPGDPWTPSGLYNGMIHPLIPYAIRGILWYQGENNTDHSGEYHKLFATMIISWRAHFGQGDCPFYWVQLPNYGRSLEATGQAWAYLREAQSQTLSLPATGQAVTIDIGDPDNGHPANKQEVGRRLALIAKANTYGIPVDFSGPVFASATREGSAMRIHFKYADDGLTAADKPLQSFELAAADQKFHPAAALISGNTVVVHAPDVASPVAVRYAWRNAPEANLFNGGGLPAMPFRSDDW